MPSSAFAPHISTEHLCYENAVRRSSLASDYDVDKRLTTPQTWRHKNEHFVKSRIFAILWPFKFVHFHWKGKICAL